MEQFGTWQWSSQTDILTGGQDKPVYHYCKRCIDLGLAILALMLLFPVMLVMALLIKVDSAGPIFYTQERVGAKRCSKNGRTSWEIRRFQMIKFRSMVQDADTSIHRAYIKAFIQGQVETSGMDTALYKLTNDPRVTRVGRIIRKTSLDELPQLINVLKGEMSLVGPRPVPEYEVAGYEGWHHERLATLPGITGLWQVKGRCQVSFEKMVRLDIDYVRHQSLWLDLKILILTIPAVLSGQGAE